MNKGAKEFDRYHPYFTRKKNACLGRYFNSLSEISKEFRTSAAKFRVVQGLAIFYKERNSIEI